MKGETKEIKTQLKLWSDLLLSVPVFPSLYRIVQNFSFINTTGMQLLRIP